MQRSPAILTNTPVFQLLVWQKELFGESFPRLPINKVDDMHVQMSKSSMTSSFFSSCSSIVHINTKVVLNTPILEYYELIK